MHKKYNKPLFCIAVVSLLVAVVGDGFMSGHGLGTVIGCLIMMVAILVCASMDARAKSRAFQAAKRDFEVRSNLSKTPIFAHVPGPGEPGYDQNYDPDDDKYWRRCYRDDD